MIVGDMIIIEGLPPPDWNGGMLEYVFGFVPPDLNSLPEIHGRLSRAYLSPAQ